MTARRASPAAASPSSRMSCSSSAARPTKEGRWAERRGLIGAVRAVTAVPRPGTVVSRLQSDGDAKVRPCGGHRARVARTATDMKPQGMARRKRALRTNGARAGTGKELTMKSKAVSLVLAAVIGVASLPTVSRADGDDDSRKAATVADQVAKAMPETPPTEPTTGHKALVYTLKGVEGVEVGLGILEATGPVALGFEIAGPLAAMATFWIELGGAHQEAINS